MVPGPTGQRVAENVAALRATRGYTKTELARRVAELGRPMTLDVLTKLESGNRRVDPDDLIALADALGVTPNRLLLPAKAGDTEVALTPARTVTATEAWEWACGEKPLRPTDGSVLADYARFPLENRPHHHHRDLTPEQGVVLAPVREAARRAFEAGYPLSFVIDCVEFESLAAAMSTRLAHQYRSVTDSAPAIDTVSRVVTTARGVHDTAPASDATTTEGSDDGR
jgi:transcriptional regulator with XRE-family HTH domain